MKKVYIYHHNDHDGIVAAGILYNYIIDIGIYKPEDIIFNMIDYQKELNFDHIDFDNNEQVWFLDYSFSNEYNKKEFEKLLKRRKYTSDITWIDHHKTSVRLFEGYQIPGIRDTALSATALTYFVLNLGSFDYTEVIDDMTIADLIHKNKHVPKFIKYIDDYDCWKKLYPETNDFHYGLTLSDPKDPIINKLLNSNKDINDIISTGKKIQEYLAFENKEYHVDMYGFEYILPEEHGGYKCFCMNRKGNSIMFGDKIKEYDAVIPFYFNGSRWTYSMFTEKDNVDCESVARSYGGGGHLKAAGWTFDKLIF